MDFIPVNREIDYNYLKSQLSKYKNVRVKINDLLKKKLLVRVKKGFYIVNEPHDNRPVCTEVFANMIYGPSYISLEYALSFRGVIPERAEVITSVTPKRNKSFDTPVGRFTYQYMNADLYPFGVALHRIDETHNILMAGRETALADRLYFEKRFSSVADLRSFLFDNLRCDIDEIRKFRITVVRKLAFLYGGNSRLFLQILEELR